MKGTNAQVLEQLMYNFNVQVKCDLLNEVRLKKTKYSTLGSIKKHNNMLKTILERKVKVEGERGRQKCR